MANDNDGWIKTTCAYCGVGCGVEAKPLRSGQLDIRGDKSHPANYGKLCTKGIALGETVGHEGRLLSPIIRQNDEERTADWNESTQLVADTFKQAIKEYGSDSVAFYVSGQLLTEDYYVANKLMKGFIGSGNIDSNSRLCMASSVVGHKRAFGTDTVPVCYDDLEKAEMVILVGSNLAWCHPVLFQRLRAAKQANPHLHIVVIDPRETESHSISDQHLAIQSGGDVALFNGLLGYLAEHDILDQAYIEAHTTGFDLALESALSEAKVSDLTGLSAQALTSFYQRFAQTDKVVTIYSQGVNQSSQGSDKVNSILNCHLATGKIGKEGCGPFSVTGQPNAMGGREVGALANTLAAHMEFDNSQHLALISEYWQTNTLATSPGLKAIDLFDAMAEGKIKAVWIMATNPMVSLPDSAKIKQALETCPFVVVSDCIADTETTRLADVVLPAQGWSEKSGTVTNSERRISRQRRILPSPGLAKPDWWVISQVAQKMGYAGAFDYLHEGEIFLEYARMTTLDNHNNQRDLNLIGLANLDDEGYGQLTPQQWPVKQLQQKVVHHRFFSEGNYYTSNGRANFVAVKHHAPRSSVSTSFPLLLNSGRTRDHWHTMTRTGLSASLGSHSPEPYVVLSPAMARTYGVSHNSLARLSNLFGTVLARAKVSEKMEDDQLFMPIHWNDTTSKSGKPCALIAPFQDSISGQPEFKHTPVMLEPVEMNTYAALLSREPIECDQFEYWAKQKISSGWFYHIESTLTVEELKQVLTPLLGHVAEREFIRQYPQKNGYRLLQVSTSHIERLVMIQPCDAQRDPHALIEGFNQSVNEMGQSELLEGDSGSLSLDAFSSDTLQEVSPA